MSLRVSAWRRGQTLVGSAALLLMLLVSANAVATNTATPFGFVPPSFLGAATVSHNLLGANFVFLARARTQHALLMISTMHVATVRRELGPLSAARCVALFQQELGRSHARFFPLPVPEPLAVGSGQFTQVRWTAHKDDHTETGALACGQLGDRYYVVHFADELKSAIVTFPSIRAALAALRPKPE